MGVLAPAFGGVEIQFPTFGPTGVDAYGALGNITATRRRIKQILSNNFTQVSNFNDTYYNVR